MRKFSLYCKITIHTYMYMCSINAYALDLSYICFSRNIKGLLCSTNSNIDKCIQSFENFPFAVKQLANRK